jgi:hypothetical protein
MLEHMLEHMLKHSAGTYANSAGTYAETPLLQMLK